MASGRFRFDREFSFMNMVYCLAEIPARYRTYRTTELFFFVKINIYILKTILFLK